MKGRVGDVEVPLLNVHFPLHVPCCFSFGCDQCIGGGVSGISSGSSGEGGGAVGSLVLLLLLLAYL